VSAGDAAVVYTLLPLVSAAGLMASAGCHVAALLGATPPGGKAAFALHVGIFAVWIPLVICANRTKPDGAGGNLDLLLAELPGWVGGAALLLFAYAIVNFVTFLAAATQYPRGQVPLALELRGFSGHWMMFYGIATIGFLGLARRGRKARPH
jgi:hypothetical protein